MHHVSNVWILNSTPSDTQLCLSYQRRCATRVSCSRPCSSFSTYVYASRPDHYFMCIYVHAIPIKMTQPSVVLRASANLLILLIDRYRPWISWLRRCLLFSSPELALCRIGRSYSVIRNSRVRVENTHMCTRVQSYTTLCRKSCYITTIESADATTSKAWLCWNSTPFTAVLLMKDIAASFWALKNDRISGGETSRYPFPCHFQAFETSRKCMNLLATQNIHVHRQSFVW